MYKIDVEEILKVMEEVILENVKDSVRPFSFLTIKTKTRPSRNGYDPNKGEHVVFPERTVPNVSFGKEIKEAVE